MPRKDEFLSQLLSSKTQEIVSSPGKYTAFLQTAAQNYKYGFQEQVLIHAQRPDATACAEIGVWNRLGRWVNRGATGIALLRSPNLPYRIRYVFDVSDTNNRENREISLWQMKPAYENEVIRTLQDKFLLDSDSYFGEIVEVLSQRLAEEAVEDYLPDLLNNKQDSFLEELDDGSVARWFKESVSESVRYMVLHRCGYAPELDNDVFGRIQDFNTEITASLLGSAVSTLSESILREIGVTVKSLERRQSRTFDSFGDTVYNEARKNEMERSQNNGTDLHNAGGLPAAQPDTPRESQGRQVRNASPQLPPQAPGGAIYRDADEGHSERPSGGGGPGGQPDAGTADNADGPGARRDGGTESPESDAVGPADEQHPAGRRGDHLQSADLRVIEESPLPSVEEQVSFLDGGFSVPEEAQQAFFPQLQLPQQVIDEALCMGFNDRDSRKIICAYFMKDKPDNADFLQRSYGTNGAGLIIQDQDYAVWYDPEGIRISPGHTVRNLHTTLVTWEQAAKRIRELLDMGRYIPKDELEQVPAFERRRIAQSLAFAVRECSAQVKEDGYLPLTAKTYSSNRGFPEIEAQMQRLLESPDTLKQLIDEWTLFAAAHANDRSLMVSRLYNPAELLQKLEDLQRIPLTFTAAEGFDSLRRYFISDDEINQALRGHESEFRSRLDVFSFFIRNTDAKEREKFLKRQHGEYSGYHGGNDNRVYDSTGFFFSHGSIGAPYAQVNMKWPAVTKWVSNMISAGVYLYPSDTDKMADYEINQLARQIMSFFSNAPDGFQRPTPRSDFDYWEGVAEIQEQLSDPEQVNTIYVSMMQPLMEATQPSDRSFEIRKRGMEAMESYLAGTFSVFGKDHTIRPLARQAVNEDLEKAKELITEFCAEEYDSEPDFSDLRKVDIAYTTITDEEVPVQVSVDLMDFKLDRYIDGIIVDSRKYSSLKELTEQELTDPDFDELTAFSEEQFAKVALHGIQNKVVQRLTDNGEEIQIQLHVNGFYYNHYGMTDGTARYIDGPFDTLEDAAEEVHNYHPQAAQIADSVPDMEEDTFDDIDPQQVREELAKGGIVDGKLVDPEALENTPFIRQVMADAGAAELPPSSPILPHALQPEVAADDRRNYHISTNDLGIGVPIERFYHNVHAIELLHKLEAENRLATPDEQDILSQYVGWGGLPQFFEESNAHYAELKVLLTEDEYTAARESTLTAFYTPPVVIRAMYQVLANLGFQTGNILEPSMGVGNFFGMLPESMKSSRLYGVELDSITGRIAKQLYPKADITVAGFETTDRKDFFDLAVGNVPFGQYQVSDRAFDKLGFSIHNYFFAKALEQVRPGGVVAFVTSRYTMDAKDSAARKYIAQRADFLGAIRLPNNAFRANAGTDVVSDIIFLQKRDRPIEIEPDWVHTGIWRNPGANADGFAINQYFIDHPEMVLGRQTSESTQYGRQDFTVAPIEGADLAEQLSGAIRNIRGTYAEAELPDLGEDETIVETVPADPNVRNFSYTVVDGELYYRQNSIMTKPDFNATAKERAKGMVELRDCVQKLISEQMDGFISDETIRQTQAELNTLYDGFTAKYGLINSRANALAFAEDSSYYLLCSLEELDEDKNLKRKADMFTRRTIRAHEAVTSVDTASEALALSISEKACVDMEYMSKLTGKSEDDIIDELNGVIFLDPVYGNWQTADEYLSGNVRQKLREAEQAAQDSPGYLPNVEALRQAQPKDLDASEIEVRLGATWIDPAYIREFMWETFETPFYQQRMIDVTYSAFTAEWNIRNKNAVSYSNIAAYMTYGTERANAYKILEDTLNLRDVRIYDTKHDADGRERRVLNSKETTLAQQKQQAIKDAFRDWIWRDPDRRHTLVARYNELFNSTRPREYDGSHITFAGMNPEIRLREHQLNAVAHVLYGGNTLLAHEVGAGKTFEMVAAAMESKRLGLCHKSLFVVPNHLTEQWSGEFLRLYPSANILVATKKDFEPKNRKKFCARIATGEYDAVIIGHSQFEKIPVSMERQQRLLAEQIFEVEEGLRELKSQRAERFTIKSLERTKRGLEAKLKKLQDSSRKDDVVTFEQLGVDRLYVDEAHNYKNLFLYTKMRNVAGLSATDAQKSSDMLLKCRYIDEITDSRGVVFATGTPVSNSMTELYTMMRYLQHDAIRGKGLAHFDCWASTFGETQTAIELAPEGTGYRARTRFAKFFNLPELMTLFKEAADIKTSDQLNLPTPTPIYHNEVAQPTEIQKQMVQELSERAARVHAQLVDPGTDNMLKITSDGRKLGLDQRIINPDLPDDPNSKVNRCVDNIHRIWQDGQADRLTQLVFCDLSTPKTGATGAKAAKTAGGNLDSPELNALERLIDKDNPDEPGFTVYDDIREKLVARGIPREQIAFIHEANTETRKKELFAKVRSGQVRVLMGSTFKMGAGMNVQDRLVALHDLDCPWRPGDLEQRSGRIIRQGNRNKEVHIYRYVTESTFDAYLWQTVENKQKFISQIMTSKSPVRSCEDVDETALSYAEIKALCAGDERIKEKMDLDVDVARLKLMKASHQSQQFRLEDNLLRHFPEQIRQNESFVEGFTADMQTLAGHPHPVDGFAGMEVKGDLLTDKDNAGAAILEAFKDAKGMEPVPIGSYRGFAMSLTVEDFGRDFILTLKGKMNHRVTLGKDARGNLTRIDNALNAMPDRLQNVRNTLDALTAQMETAKAELGKPFPQEDELRTKSARLAELNAELNIDDRTPMEQMAEDAPAVQSAKAERPSVLAKLKAPLSQPCAEDKIRHRNKEER